MRFLSDNMRAAHEKLTEIAGGDSLLVERSLCELNARGYPPTLHEITQLILTKRAAQMRNARPCWRERSLFRAYMCAFGKCTSGVRHGYSPAGRTKQFRGY